jgi:hypothetical protein
MRLVTESAAGEREPGTHTHVPHTYTYTILTSIAWQREKERAERLLL